MASFPRPAPPRPARAVRRRHPFTRLLVVGIFCGLSYGGLTSGAFGPADGLDGIASSDANLVTASISYSGVDPVLTGSVDHLFNTASFTGPNRAQKTDRLRPKVDVVAVSQTFDEVRTRIASLRAEANKPVAIQFASTASGDVEPGTAVASVSPAAAAALDAIAGIAPSSAPAALPMPAIASTQLAYARATAPVTGGYASGEVIAASEKELWCLATAIYFEARGESYRGQVAVAQVVGNRVKDHRYPDTMCGVVFQNQSRRNACQFSFACDGIPEVINDKESWAQAEDIAKRYASGELYLTEVGDATHYHATYVSPPWAPRMTKVTQIGLHVFYKFKRGWLFG